MDKEFLTGRIETTKLMIVAYEDAVLALSNGVTSYTLNTGQSQQTVSRASIPDLNKTLDSLYNRLVMLNARLNGSGVTRVHPAW